MDHGMYRKKGGGPLSLNTIIPKRNTYEPRSLIALFPTFNNTYKQQSLQKSLIAYRQQYLQVTIPTGNNTYKYE